MSINLYVQQLIEDLRAAAQEALKNEPTPSTTFADSFEEHIADVENYLFGKTYPLSEIVGVEKISFPPGEKLSTGQKADLAREMEKLLNANNFFPDFPKGLPDQYKYEVLRGYWDQQHIKMSGGQAHLEFCDYEPERCPFPKKYCACRNLDF